MQSPAKKFPGSVRLLVMAFGVMAQRYRAHRYRGSPPVSGVAGANPDSLSRRGRHVSVVYPTPGYGFFLT